MTNVISLSWHVRDLHCTFGFLTRTAELPLFWMRHKHICCFFLIICPMRSRPDKPPQKGEEFVQTCEGCRGNAGDIRQTYLVMFVLFCCSLNLHKKNFCPGLTAYESKNIRKTASQPLQPLLRHTATVCSLNHNYSTWCQWCIQGQWRINDVY